MALEDVVSLAIVELDGTELTTAAELHVTRSMKKKAVKTLNRANRSIGYQHGVPDFSGTLKVVILAGGGEKPWEQYVTDGSVHLLVYERTGGERRQLSGFVVDDVGEPYNADTGETMQDISFTALDDRPEA